VMDDARYPSLILVPRRANLRALLEWTSEDRQILLDEIKRCAHVLNALEKPDKLNIATLGNVVAQLHVHVIARRTCDAAWPRPVWGTGERVPYDPSTLHLRAFTLRTALRLDQRT